jgi:hypothetical protein
VHRLLAPLGLRPRLVLEQRLVGLRPFVLALLVPETPLVLNGRGFDSDARRW